jgi:hypothetical protein
MQITNRETKHLLNGLRRWPAVELRLFLSQLMHVSMLDYQNWHVLVRCSGIPSPYDDIRYDSVCSGDNIVAPGDDSVNDLVAIIDFIALVVDHEEEVGMAALDGGLLNLLLRIYVFWPALQSADKSIGMTSLLRACTSALHALSRHPENRQAVISHPVCTLWTQCGQCFYVPDAWNDPFSSRCGAWRQTDKYLIMTRLVTIYRFSLSSPYLDDAVVTDVHTDLAVLSRSASLILLHGLLILLELNTCSGPGSSTPRSLNWQRYQYSSSYSRVAMVHGTCSLSL